MNSIDDTDFRVAKQLDHFSELDVFGSSHGLNVAVSLTVFDSNTELVLDKSYGEFKFLKSQWGIDETDGSFFHQFIDLEAYPCTKEELGIDQE